MRKLTAVLLTATMILSLYPTFQQNSYDIKAFAAESGIAEFDEDEFYVVVGTFGGATQLRALTRRSDGSYAAEKIVWESAPQGLSYGDVLTTEGKVIMEQVRPASDPVYAMAYYYKLDDSAKLTKVGSCAQLMEKKDLTVKRVTYDGSAHWSIDYTDENGEKYYYGLSTYGSSLGVNPTGGKEGDIYTFAAIDGNIVVPLAKKDVESVIYKQPEYKIVKLPDKVEYKLGETIDLTGLEIEVTKANEEPVVYTYPDIAFAHDSNTPKSPTVLLFSDFRSDKAGTYKVEVLSADNVSFEVKVIDDEETSASTVRTTILDINDNTIMLKHVEGAYELRSCKIFAIETQALGSNITPTVGMKLDITYWEILEDFPAQFGHVRKVAVVKDEDGFVKGDANCDEQVDMADAVLIMQALANPNKYGENGTAMNFNYLTALGKINADMNGDGLTVGDAQAIQRKLLGLNDESIEMNSKIKDIVTIKTDYDPSMSNWSGIGILLEINSKDYPVTLKTVDGHFSSWDINTGSGPVENMGKTYDVGNFGYIFWTPDALDYSKGFNTEIQAVGVSGDVFIDLGKIYVTQIEHRFIASFINPDSNKSSDYSVIAGKTFVYEKKGFGSDFEISFDMNGSYSYYEGALSSYIGSGVWVIIDNIVVMTERTANKINHMIIEGNDLVYIAAGSDNFYYLKVDDGDRFSLKANSADLLGIDK